jgi:hypothetical protein
MSVNRLIRSALVTLGLVACASPAGFDSPAFARRAPLPGQMGYLETIRYIADGLHYVSASATFFVSPQGEMCFQGLPSEDRSPYVFPAAYWCINPLAVASVDRVRNDVTQINGVRLWCRLSTPQCAHKIAGHNPLDRSLIANSIIAETIPSAEQAGAIEHLIYLMGGDIGGPGSPAWHRSAALATPP